MKSVKEGYVERNPAKMHLGFKGLRVRAIGKAKPKKNTSQLLV